MTTDTYEATWGTDVGGDCISLNTTLCEWLGQRLMFLGTHTRAAPLRWELKDWRADLVEHGTALRRYAMIANNDIEATAAKEAAAYTDAQSALRFVASHLGDLWD